MKTVIRLAAKPVSVVDGALLTAGANSIGTLGGGVLGTAGMTYLWLRRRGVNAGAAGLGGWLPIFLNDATLAFVSLVGLAILVSLKKSSGVLVAGLCFAILTLAGGAGFLSTPPPEQAMLWIEASEAWTFNIGAGRLT